MTRTAARGRKILKMTGGATIATLGIIAPILASETDASAGPPPPGGTGCYYTTAGSYPGYVCEDIAPISNHTTHYISSVYVIGSDYIPGTGGEVVSPSKANAFAGQSNPIKSFPARWSSPHTAIAGAVAYHNYAVHSTWHTYNYEICGGVQESLDGYYFQGPLACNSIH